MLRIKHSEEVIWNFGTSTGWNFWHFLPRFCFLQFGKEFLSQPDLSHFMYILDIHHNLQSKWLRKLIVQKMRGREHLGQLNDTNSVTGLLPRSSVEYLAISYNKNCQSKLMQNNPPPRSKTLLKFCQSSQNLTKSVHTVHTMQACIKQK